MANHPGFLGTLSIDVAGGTSYTSIGQIRDLSGPTISRNSIEVADRSSTNYYNDYLGGRVDAGSISFGLTWDPVNDTTHGQTTGTGLLADFETDQCTQATWQWQLDGCGGTMTFTFAGFVESFDIDAPFEDMVTAEVGIKISGKPTLAVA
jgi:hypothetical protein